MSNGLRVQKNVPYFPFFLHLVIGWVCFGKRVKIFLETLNIGVKIIQMSISASRCWVIGEQIIKQIQFLFQPQTNIWLHPFHKFIASRNWSQAGLQHCGAIMVAKLFKANICSSPQTNIGLCPFHEALSNWSPVVEALWRLT